ncbi:hypothetical protein BHE74_00008402 [Ensete ventricosum]|nr:hypothetical protein GW17_00045200 [Ensete ventricosum]RWW83104.1 hypothetical protein BHE74_00008402 [Ensete ventricosum]RZR86905.1 hypothetical protein BHM03_00014204 [Ensete ventricosum]
MCKIFLASVLYHPFTKEEQLMALQEEKRTVEERRKLKEAGVIGSTMDALGGAASLVGSGVGFVGTGLETGVGMVGTGIGSGVGMVGSGVGMVGSGLGAGVGIVGTGLGAFGSGLSRAGKFMGKSVTNQFSSSRRNISGPSPAVQGDGNAS